MDKKYEAELKQSLDMLLRDAAVSGYFTKQPKLIACILEGLQHHHRPLGGPADEMFEAIVGAAWTAVMNYCDALDKSVKPEELKETIKQYMRPESKAEAKAATDAAVEDTMQFLDAKGVSDYYAASESDGCKDFCDCICGDSPPPVAYGAVYSVRPEFSTYISGRYV